MKTLHHLLLVAVAACLVMLTGCVTAVKPALRKPADRLDPGKDAVVLMTLKLSNQVHPSYQPVFTYAQLSSRALYANPSGHKKPLCIAVDKEFNDYIVTMKLPGGAHTLKTIQVSSHIPLVLEVNSVIPMNMSFNVEPGHVYYLGRIEAVIRKRENGEPVAARFPLVDAAIAGYSSGTWDVTIRDNYESDMERILSSYPAVQGAKVDKQILPAWTR
jgi:hypothetical protein